METEYKRRAVLSIILGLTFVVLCALSLSIPEFGNAVRETVYCSFANVTCVKVLP